ncbi:MAG: class I SAM-dependent methyltransferase [Chloroflexi bacterium]|nr:class I SAM-dependent methyltransferase [Chloroflexota bacterium]
MSLAPSRRPPSDELAFDLDYSVHDVEIDTGRDTTYLTHRIEQLMLQEGFRPAGRTLDVACGIGKLAASVGMLGGEGWALDPSEEMLGLGQFIFEQQPLALARGVAEELPFRDGSFDRVICQGSLDHFVDPRAFMNEAARVLRPDGRAVIALANYESLSCHIGRLRQRISTGLLRRPVPPERLYWQIPPDHYHKGDLSFVLRLGGERFRLVRCYGVSLLWLTKGWGKFLEPRPRSLTDRVLWAFDRIAYIAPELADMIVSVWQPVSEHEHR